jgi:hypothetical protein
MQRDAILVVDGQEILNFGRQKVATCNLMTQSLACDPAPLDLEARAVLGGSIDISFRIARPRPAEGFAK